LFYYLYVGIEAYAVFRNVEGLLALVFALIKRVFEAGV